MSGTDFHGFGAYIDDLDSLPLPVLRLTGEQIDSIEPPPEGGWFADGARVFGERNGYYTKPDSNSRDPLTGRFAAFHGDPTAGERR